MRKSNEEKWLQRWEKFYTNLRLANCTSCGGCGEELEGDDLVYCGRCHGDGDEPPGQLGTTFLAIRQEERVAFAEEIILRLADLHFVGGGGIGRVVNPLGADEIRQLAKEQPK